MTDNLPANHPSLPDQKVGVLVANLGTPDGTDYWSMRRYLNEFLSDRRVIDYPAWKWQPILQTIILTKRHFLPALPISPSGTKRRMKAR